MSEKPSEYLKRTCLICGCHTNLTINIYEPRSGPNIVELIQAKFKFQPLNDDKYLCFSCNNWLINWHSLQALNSNDAESPSGTFQSHMNNMVQEKGGAGSQQRAILCRPIAHVRPRQLETVASTQPPTTVPTPVPIAEHKSDFFSTDVRTSTPPINAKPKKLSYIKRSFRSAPASSTIRSGRRPRMQKSLQNCCACGRAIVIRRSGSNSGSTTASMSSAKRSTTARCRKCREVCKWRAIYLNSLAKAERHQQMQQRQRLCKQPAPNQSLVNINKREEFSQNQSQRLPRPRVDGKIVSMLRRLGTTLSREQTSENAHQQQQHHHHQQNVQLPTIMSPAKQKPRWTRQLDENEILLDFNTAISEVLPLIAEHAETQSACVGGQSGGKQVRRKLTYQVTDVSSEGMRYNQANNSVEVLPEEPEASLPQAEEVEVLQSSTEQWNPLESFYSGCLPRGLSVSLI